MSCKEACKQTTLLIWGVGGTGIQAGFFSFFTMDQSIKLHIVITTTTLKINIYYIQLGEL